MLNKFLEEKDGDFALSEMLEKQYFIKALEIMKDKYNKEDKRKASIFSHYYENTDSNGLKRYDIIRFLLCQKCHTKDYVLAKFNQEDLDNYISLDYWDTKWLTEVQKSLTGLSATPFSLEHVKMKGRPRKEVIISIEEMKEKGRVGRPRKINANSINEVDNTEQAIKAISEEIDPFDLFLDKSLNDTYKKAVSNVGFSGLKTIINMQAPPSAIDWDKNKLLPLNSTIEKVVRFIDQATNINNDIPFYTYLSLLSGILLKNNITSIYDNCIYHPCIWTILYAPSSSGKTWCSKQIVGIDELFKKASFDYSNVISHAAFFELLPEMNKCTVVCDEVVNEMFIPFKLNKHGHEATKKDLLKIYNHEKVFKKTKDENFESDEMYISFLGYTQHENFRKNHEDVDFINGFFQRFNHVLIKPNKKKAYDEKYYHWKNIDSESLSNTFRFKELRAINYIKHNYDGQLIVPSDVISYFFGEFGKLWTNNDVEEGFMRRILYTVHSYAILYHVITGNIERELTTLDYDYGIELAKHNIAGIKELLYMGNMSEIETLCRKVEVFINKQEARNIEVSERTIMQNVRGFKSVAGVRNVLGIINRLDLLNANGLKKYQGHLYHINNNRGFDSYSDDMLDHVQ